MSWFLLGVLALSLAAGPVHFLDDETLSLLKEGDYDRYLSALFAPASMRAPLLALYAFNLETARIRETVSEALIGRMRLQWWRDRLGEIAAGDPPQHPIAKAISLVLRGAPLEPSDLSGLIDAREFDMADEPPKTLIDLEAYAAATAGGVARAAVKLLGGGKGAEAAGQAAGTAYGLVGLMRAVPFHASARRSYLPEDLRARAGLDTGRLFDRGHQPELEAIVKPVLRRAWSLLESVSRLEKRYRSPLLTGRLAARDIDFMAANAYNPFVVNPKRRGLGLMASLWLSNQTGRIV